MKSKKFYKGFIKHVENSIKHNKDFFLKKQALKQLIKLAKLGVGTLCVIILLTGCKALNKKIIQDSAITTPSIITKKSSTQPSSVIQPNTYPIHFDYPQDVSTLTNWRILVSTNLIDWDDDYNVTIVTNIDSSLTAYIHAIYNPEYYRAVAETIPQ